MTAQIGDKFIFNGERYSIVAISPQLKFDPRKYGITPVWACTACWDGYWCVYNITDEGIFLEDLYVNSLNDYYPEIEGVSALSDDGKGKDFSYMGHHLYKGLHIKMNYSGKILVGDKFISRYYIHMGYQRAWAYEVLTEFVFENGDLKETNDHSDIAAKLREKIEEGKRNGGFFSPFHSELEAKRFVQDSFSLDYKDKAWWLKV